MIDMSFTPDDQNNFNNKVTFYFNTITLTPFIRWAKFTAIMLMLYFVFACFGIITLPFAIFGIIASSKLLNACTDIKAVMETGNGLYSEYAGENLQKHFSSLFKSYMAMIITVIIVFVVVMVLFALFTEEIVELWKKLLDGYFESGDPDSLPDNVNDLVTYLRAMF